jgi:spore coat polysaccharide biosynthesis protein SpsF
MNKKVSLIIQARMGSARLPGKSMLDLAGVPLIGRILERVKRVQKVNEIVLAIPNTSENNILGDIGREYSVTVFAGSENDLLERYSQAALTSKACFVVRLPADNATPEPSEIDRIIEHHLSLGRPGFSSNLAPINNSGYPDGIGAEIFDFSLLSEARARNPNHSMKEHIHLNFFDYSTQTAVDEKWCPVSTVPCPSEFSRPDLILDINTQAQYEFMRELYLYLYPKNQEFHITDIIKWYDHVYKVSCDEVSKATNLIKHG